MISRKKILIPTIIFLLILAAIPIALSINQAETQQQPVLLALSLHPQSPSKYTPVTWTNPTIDTINVSEDLNITLNGNLNIIGTGELHLIHCILNVNNGTTPVQYGVTVYGGLYVNESSTITALNPSYPYYFTVYEGAAFQMNDSLVEYCGHSGAYPVEQGLVVRADNAWIENNTIRNCYNGLILYQSQGNTLLNNNATNNNQNGFYLDTSDNNNLTGNTANNNYDGFYLNSSSYNNLTGNTANNNGRYSFRLLDSSYNNLTGNNATNNNAWNGFYLDTSDNNNLTGNTANNSSFGFTLSQSNGNDLIGNTAKNNGRGFGLRSDCSNNNLTGNNAINNIYAGFELYSYATSNTFTDNNVTNSNAGFTLAYYCSNNDLLGNNVLNCTDAYYWDSNSINNDFTGSVWANYLRVNVTDVLGPPIPDAHVMVETNGAVVYATPYFGGSNSVTDQNGLTPWIAVPYKTFTGPLTMTENITTITVYYQGYHADNNPRIVNMSTSHMETFQVTTEYKDAIWTNPTITSLNVSQDLYITLYGDLTIDSGGELYLRHCILKVNNGTTPIEYGVTINNGGKLYINESSTITAFNPSNPYFFVVNSGATFQMNDSRVEYCGHSSGPGVDQWGLAVEADNAWIENSTITNCYHGLILYQSQGATVLDNTATDNYIGFYLYYSSGNNLTGNIATNNDYGFYLSQTADNNNLTGNMATDNTNWGFYLDAADNNNLTGNTATDNSEGFRLWWSVGNTLMDNNAKSNTNYGFYLGYSDSNTLTGNIATNNNDGFYLTDSDGNTLTGNTALNCTTGYTWVSSINNDFTGSVEGNYLRVNVIDNGLGLPIPSAEIKVENETVVYATPWFGGLDPVTDYNGLTPWFAVPYKTFTTNDTMTENITTVTVYYQGIPIVNNPRTVDMSTSHMETFQLSIYTPVTWTNLIISDIQSYQNYCITINGNLTIDSGGELYLRHCILKVNNGTTPVQYGVTVYGRIYINESSTITAFNPSNPYFFVVNSGATFQMNDSRVEYCGHSSGTDLDQRGLRVRADNAWIENNTITHGYFGLILDHSQGHTILNNKIVNNSLHGIYMSFSDNNNLTGNTVTDNTYGFYLTDYCDGNTFTDNKAINNTYGFHISTCSNNNFTGNTATDNTNDGFYFCFYSSSNNLTGNMATNNDIGFHLDESTSNNNLLLSNNATNNNQYGFYLDSTLNNTLTGNTAINNNYGFYLYSSSDNNLTGNNAIDNNRGFYLYSGSNNNNLTGNTATDNHEIGFLLASSYNTLSGNNATNGNTGFELSSSSYNNLSGNNATNNNIGFSVRFSSNNNITGNTATNNINYGFALIDSDDNKLWDNTASNSTITYYWDSNSINNDFTGSVWANYLRVNVTDVLGLPIPDAHIMVETDGTVVYATPYFGGSNSVTDQNGLTPWFAVPYKTFTTNDTMTENTTTAEVYYQGFFFPNSPRTVNMSTSHVETFQAEDNVDPIVDITLPESDTTVNTGIIWINGSFDGTGSQVTSITINETTWFELVEPSGAGPFGVTGTYAFRNRTAIPTGEYNILITVQDQAEHTETATRRVIVDQDNPTVSITDPPSDGTINTGVIWINGTFDDTGSQVTSISINDTARFELVEPAGAGPYGETGTFAFRNKTAIPTGEFGVVVTVEDQAQLMGTATRHVIVDQDIPIVTIDEPPSDDYVNTGVIWVNGTFNGTGSQVTSITINDTVRFELVEPAGAGPYGVTGTYAFRNKTAIPTGEYNVLITVQDQAEHTETATRRVIVDQDNPTVSITDPYSDDTINTGVIWVNGTFNGTGSQVTSITINDTLGFELVEPAGAGPFGETGIYAFRNKTAIPTGEFGVMVTVTDQSGLTGTASRHIIVDQDPPIVTITVPMSDTTVNSGVIWINGTFNGTGSQVTSISINDTLRFELVEPAGAGPFGETGIFAFRNKTVIPTGEFGVFVSVTDQAGLTGTASRHVIVDQDQPTVTITIPASDTTVNSGVIWINGTFNGTGSQVTSITINDTVRFELVEPMGAGPYGETGTFAFRNKTAIPTGEFGVVVTIEDQEGRMGTSTRHLIVDQDNPVVVITVPPSDGSVSVGDVWINGTFDGTGSQVVSIDINDTSFTIVEPAGGGPFGATGTYCFRASITEAGDFYINITAYDQAGHKGTATIHFSVVELPPEEPSPLPMFAALMLAGMQAGVSPLVYAAVGAVAVVGIAAAASFYYFRRRRV